MSGARCSHRLRSRSRIESLPDDARSGDEGRPNWPKEDLKSKGPWYGIHKDVGIFSEEEWNFIMVKCLASMGACLSLFGAAGAVGTEFRYRDSLGGYGVVDYGPVCGQAVELRDREATQTVMEDL